jgi:hypothetical protein
VVTGDRIFSIIFLPERLHSCTSCFLDKIDLLSTLLLVTIFFFSRIGCYHNKQRLHKTNVSSTPRLSGVRTHNVSGDRH